MSQQQQYGTCIILLLTWIMSADGRIEPEELQLLHQISQPMDLTNKIDDLLLICNDDNYEDILYACDILNNTLDDEAKRRLMELFMGMTLADKILTISENIVLRFISDALSISFTILNDIFVNATGHPLPQVGDPSSADWWLKKENKSKKQSNQNRANQSSYSSVASSDKKAWALSVLGRVQTATQEEMKASYRRLAQLHHPDKYFRLGPEAMKAANVIFQHINEAYQVLII